MVSWRTPYQSVWVPTSEKMGATEKIHMISFVYNGELLVFGDIAAVQAFWDSVRN